MPQDRASQIEAAALAFHAANPHVWGLFVNFTLERIGVGFKNYSVNAIFERIRWATDQADSDGRSTFKINNNYRPYYARRFMAEYPMHKGFFRTRKLTSMDEAPATGPELGPLDFLYESGDEAQ
ncbi:MAG: hypothetical protein L3J33_03250 [Rhodobacteraceae bacterium]|nr:hypothetical protein [Paracoccaceae bacterium]